MDGMTIQDVMALNEITRKDHNEGKWSMATSLWVIVGIIVVVAWLWYVHRSGADKADLAASVQKLVGRVDAIEPAVTAQGNNLFSINSVLSATTQAFSDYKSVAEAQLASLNGAVFTSRCGGGCNNGGTRFVKRDNYCLSDSSLQAIDTCGGNS
jgi:uncharacterized protein (UPF0333 family)